MCCREWHRFLELFFAKTCCVLHMLLFLCKIDVYAALIFTQSWIFNFPVDIDLYVLSSLYFSPEPFRIPRKTNNVLCLLIKRTSYFLCILASWTVNSRLLSSAEVSSLFTNIGEGNNRLLAALNHAYTALTSPSSKLGDRSQFRVVLAIHSGALDYDASSTGDDADNSFHHVTFSKLKFEANAQVTDAEQRLCDVCPWFC